MLFQAIVKMKILMKYVKNHTPCRDFKVIKNASNF